MIIGELHGKNYDKIHTLNRAQLIDDSFNLAKYGYLQISVALDVLKYLRQEIDLTPLRAAIEEFRFLEKVFAGHDQYDQLQV
jgi:aminopeptidase N